ncbi:trypsin-like serine peptidase [Streptomyces silaceus]|uniref:trypsin-like serine peptidase n=1 Tax=Streptomyces silaceus TaxID=545123 RepID=UPI000A63363C|nr:trypsin-like serine protease [Streptomyces silaceus]
MPETTTSVTRRLRGRVTGLAVAGTALALAVPVPATAATSATVQARAAADPVSVLKFTTKERKDALAYWTPARIKAVGKSVDLGPTGPKAQPWRGTTLKTVGRLFFVNASGADTWCTATAVKSANRSTVMTAAHCVRRGSSPYNTNMSMVFVPAYHKGKMPHGAFAVRQAATPRTWETDSKNDMSALTVDPPRAARSSPMSWAARTSPSTAPSAAPSPPSATPPPVRSSARNSCAVSVRRRRRTARRPFPVT